MLYGLYHSAQGAQAQTLRIEVLSNNLANASTTAFKRDLALFQSHRPYDVENGGGVEPPGNQNALTGGITPAKVVTDYSAGPLVKTGGSFDLALTGPGFFQVSDGSRQFLTRNGQFTLNQNGEIVSAGSGMRVMSTSGTAITISSEATQVSIAADGTVTAMSNDGSTTQVGKLAVVQPGSNQQLQKVGNSLFAASGPVSQAGSDVAIKQGYIEGSDVNPVQEMLDLIQASRSVESNVNMMKLQDDALERLLQSAGGH